MDRLLFFDIETHRVKNWDELTPLLQKAFREHVYEDNSEITIEECYQKKAGLLAEFSQVTCISLGYEQNEEFKLNTIYGVDEVALLNQLSKILNQFEKNWYVLAGHNIIGFDCPYLNKRYIINGIRIPKLINSFGKKPWEITNVDTMLMWKFSGWSNTSLEVICSALGIESKSYDISGKTMYKYDIKDMDWEELKKYCEEDVKATYEIYKRIKKFL